MENQSEKNTIMEPFIKGNRFTEEKNTIIEKSNDDEDTCTVKQSDTTEVQLQPEIISAVGFQTNQSSTDFSVGKPKEITVLQPNWEAQFIKEMNVELHAIGATLKQTTSHLVFDLMTNKDSGSGFSSDLLTSSSRSSTLKSHRYINSELSNQLNSKAKLAVATKTYKTMCRLIDKYSISKSTCISFKPNKSCFQNYKKISSLGSGTYARVWQVKSVLDKRTYAAKLLQPHTFSDQTYTRVLQMFVKEVVNLLLCQSPGVVHVKEVILGVEGWLIVQELVDDGTVWREKICKNEYDAFLFFIQLMQGVMFLQTRKIVHRDLKPTNILIFKNKRLVLGDFGWSEHELNLNLFPHEWPGTLEINPPEILMSTDQLSNRIDNYAVGMNLLLFFSGKFICRKKGLSVGQAAPHVLRTVHEVRTGLPPLAFRNSPGAWEVFIGLTNPDPHARWTLENTLQSRWVSGRLLRLVTSSPQFIWYKPVQERVASLCLSMQEPQRNICHYNKDEANNHSLEEKRNSQFVTGSTSVASSHNMTVSTIETTKNSAKIMNKLFRPFHNGSSTNVLPGRVATTNIIRNKTSDNIQPLVGTTIHDDSASSVVELLQKCQIKLGQNEMNKSYVTTTTGYHTSLGGTSDKTSVISANDDPSSIKRREDNKTKVKHEFEIVTSVLNKENTEQAKNALNDKLTQRCCFKWGKSSYNRNPKDIIDIASPGKEEKTEKHFSKTSVFQATMPGSSGYTSNTVTDFTTTSEKNETTENLSKKKNSEGEYTSYSKPCLEVFNRSLQESLQKKIDAINQTTQNSLSHNKLAIEHTNSNYVMRRSPNDSISGRQHTTAGPITTTVPNSPVIPARYLIPTKSYEHDMKNMRSYTHKDLPENSIYGRLMKSMREQEEGNTRVTYTSLGESVIPSIRNNKTDSYLCATPARTSIAAPSYNMGSLKEYQQSPIQLAYDLHGRFKYTDQNLIFGPGEIERRIEIQGNNKRATTAFLKNHVSPKLSSSIDNTNIISKKHTTTKATSYAFQNMRNLNPIRLPVKKHDPVRQNTSPDSRKDTEPLSSLYNRHSISDRNFDSHNIRT